DEIIFERTKVGFFMLLISALIKSAALVILFYLAFSRYLKKPLDRLTKQVSAIKDKGYGGEHIDAGFKDKNELSMLQESFNDLLEHIRTQEEAKTQIVSEQNKLLETEVHRRTKELRKSELRHRVIFEESASPGIVWKEGFIITDWNKKAEELFGWSKEEVLGRCTLDFLVPMEIRDSLESKFSEITDNTHMMPRSINQNLTKDGRVITCQWFNSPLPIIEGEPEEVVSLAVDITERQRAEAVMMESKQRAEAATQAKSEFLANMSHEIRTPISAITGMTYLIKETNLDKTQRDYINKLENSANSLLGIINDILDFSKIEAGKLELENIEFNLHDEIDNVKNIVELKAHEKGLRFVVGYENDANINLFGDPLRLGQILINLTTNAIKFTDYGEVGIYIRKIGADRFRFEVKDSGIGLNKEQQSKLFKSFSQADNTTSRKYGGTGLGLVISKQLVEMMNGRIWAESEPNVGSSFIFEIELKEMGEGVQKQEIERSPLKNRLGSLAGSKILLAEDNTLNQEILIGMLKNSGIKIDIAKNGVEAVDMFKANKAEYELVLMDIQMPIMDGYEASRLIRKMDKQIPIVALTANAMKSDADKAKDAGMNEHISKPIDPQKLFASLLSNISKKCEPTLIDCETQEGCQHKPSLQHIDIDKVVPNIIEDMALYRQIAVMFYEKYGNFEFNLDDKDSKNTIHSLKGISATIGASKLHGLCVALEKEMTKEMLEPMLLELGLVCGELECNFLPEKKQYDKIEMGEDEIGVLFDELKNALKTNKPKLISPIVQKLEGAVLDDRQEAAFEKIKKYIAEYQFDEALAALS
ncbi:MAG TPA: ATP-binding protein, partial [Campylobacterales bacterium]|nr:ATP-binding protein [Campylobacterales bacterium]